MPTFWKKRSQDMIINSGAYEREQYRRTAPLRKIKHLNYCEKFYYLSQT